MVSGKKQRNNLAGIAHITMKRADPKMTAANRLAQSGRQAGLNKSTGTYRADMALKTFSWDNEE